MARGGFCEAGRMRQRGDQPAGLPPQRRVDFFISYTGRDVQWAKWIAGVLDAAGFEVLIQAWDFRAGTHFVAEMHRAVKNALRTVAVLSAAYLDSVYAEAEWQAAWKEDPTGQARKLLVVRIEDCAQPGLLGQLVPVDLFGIDEKDAKTRLLAAAHDQRGKTPGEAAGRWPPGRGHRPARPQRGWQDPACRRIRPPPCR